MRKGLRVGLTVVGLVVMLLGILWVGQGTGLVPWPEQSFMVDRMPWAYAGMAVGLAGLVLAFWAKRFR